MIKIASKIRQNNILALKLLGIPEMRWHDTPVRLSYLKAEALLYYLATTAQPHSRTGLATLLWGGTPEKQARNSLRNALYTIRRSLSPADFLDVDRNNVRLDLANIWLDVADFQAAIADPSDTASLAAGLALWRSSFLDGISLPDAPLFESWLADQRDKLENLFTQALLRLSDMYQRDHRLEEAQSAIQRALEINPLHEIGHQQLIRLHLLQGNRAAALLQYDVLRQRLREELGVNPSLASQTLHLEILRADEVMSPTSTANQARQQQFVGRHHELALLRQLYRNILPGGPPHLVMLEGEAGIGKTRLAHEWLATLNQSRVLFARCYETEQSIPFQPWIDLIQTTLEQTGLESLDLAEVWLAELAHLVPDIRQQRPNLLPSPVTDPELTRGRIVQAIFHWVAQLARQKPVCLFIDDWQWLDQASLTVLRFILLSPSSRRLPLLILGTRRTAETPSGWPRLKSLLEREGRLDQIPLQRLSPSEAAALARTVSLPHQFRTAAFYQRLFAETEGNPLFIVELLRVFSSETLKVEADWPIPATIQSVIQNRLAALSEDTTRVLIVAAILGRIFSETELQQMAGLSGSEVLQAIDEGVAANILTEQGPVYDFTHDKIRAVLLDSLTSSRRRFLHQQVARSLEATLSNDFARLSYHFELGGDDLRARNYALRAARQAAELYADDEALRWYEKAESLLGTTPAELSPEAIPKVTPFQQSYVSRTLPLDVLGFIYRQRGLLFQRVGRYREAESRFQAALERGQAQNRLDEQAAAHNLLSFLAYLRSDYDGVGYHAQQALDLANQLGDAALRAPGLRHLGIAVYRTGDYARARILYDEALAAYGQANDGVGMAGVYNNIGFVLRTQGCYTDAIEAFHKARSLYEEMGQTEGIALIHSNVGRTYAFSGDLTEALAELTLGLTLSEESHTDWITVKIHRTLGNVFFQGQQWPQALHHAQQARVLAQSLGSDEDLGATLRLMGEIAAAWPASSLADPDSFFKQSITILEEVGAQDELERARAAYTAHVSA